MAHAERARRDRVTDRRLPVEITTRLADTGRHYEALRHALEAFGDEAAGGFETAARSQDPIQLAATYAVERPFQILAGYVVELASSGLDLAGLRSRGGLPSGVQDLRGLRDAGVLSRDQCERLIEIWRYRNGLVHEYPGIKPARTHAAARQLVRELPPFLRRYGDWLRGLGYAAPSSRGR